MLSLKAALYCYIFQIKSWRKKPHEIGSQNVSGLLNSPLVVGNSMDYLNKIWCLPQTQKGLLAKIHIFNIYLYS